MSTMRRRLLLLLLSLHPRLRGRRSRGGWWRDTGEPAMRFNSERRPLQRQRAGLESRIGSHAISWFTACFSGGVFTAFWGFWHRQGTIGPLLDMIPRRSRRLSYTWINCILFLFFWTRDVRLQPSLRSLKQSAKRNQSRQDKSRI